jgi:short-subunit dehydrogenase
MDLKLRGKVVLVTGSSRGIGLARGSVRSLWRLPLILCRTAIFDS